MNKTNFSYLNFTAFILFGIYTLGAGFIESFLNYPSWYLIGPTDAWSAYRELLFSRIIPLLALPALFLQVITNVLLFFFRPPALPRWTIHICFWLLLISVVSSFAIQIPIQMQLDQAYRPELVDKLIQSDLLLRGSVLIVRTPILLFMLYRLIKH